MTELEIKKLVKGLDTTIIGIYANQISTYINQCRSIGSELQQAEGINRRQDVPKLFDFEKRGVTLNLKVNEAITFHTCLLEELDRRIFSDLGLKLDYEYLEGVANEVYELKRGI